MQTPSVRLYAGDRPTDAFYRAAQVRECDRRAIEDHGIPGYTLMRRAAAVAWAAARTEWGLPSRVSIYCGSGNNGGDGYEIARLARADGVAVTVFELPGERRGDAATARAAWLDVGAVSAFGETEAAADWVVDAVFGTGLTRPPSGLAEQFIEAINGARDAGARVLALDLPSGLDADTGHARGAVVRADLCVSFIADKPGLHTGRGPGLCDVVRLERLSVPEAVYRELPPAAARLDATRLRDWLPARRRDAHKGSHGHVLVIGGAPGMAGAALLAGRAALRSGAGLVSLATHEAHATALVAAQPELMVHAVPDAQALMPLLARADVIALGPGLGQGDWGAALWQAALDSGKPLVLDADGLNRLALTPMRLPQAVLTPHPGEAARLLRLDTAAVNADRLEAAQALHARYGAVVVLKGAGTVVRGESTALCTAGNPGMAVGGSGDVLTGVIAALLAQGLDAESAARAGVTCHAHAGDLAARDGERGMLPGDLIEQLRGVCNP